MATPCTFVLTRPLPNPAHALLAAAGPVEYLTESGITLSDRVAQGDPVVLLTQLTDRVDASILQAASVRGVSNYAAGVDNIDLGAAAAAGVRIGHTPGVLTDPTADIAMLLILAAVRRLTEGHAMVQTGQFDGWRPDLLLSGSVTGARLGLVGRGRIAEAVARRAVGFDMDVTYALAREATAVEPTSMDALARRVSLDELIEDSDIISIHVPLAHNTRHLFDAAVFQRMKNSACLVNTARGPIIDEVALVDALRTGQIAAAGLDVFENEPALADGLASLPSVVLLPHLGSATRDTRAQMAEICALNAISLSEGTELLHETSA